MPWHPTCQALEVQTPPKKCSGCTKFPRTLTTQLLTQVARYDAIHIGQETDVLHELHAFCRNPLGLKQSAGRSVLFTRICWRFSRCLGRLAMPLSVTTGGPSMCGGLVVFDLMPSCSCGSTPKLCPVCLAPFPGENGPRNLGCLHPEAFPRRLGSLLRKFLYSFLIGTESFLVVRTSAGFAR